MFVLTILVISKQHIFFKVFYLIIKKIICKIPKYPKTGYKRFIKLENPICPINIEAKHIIPAHNIYVFLFFVTLLKKP